MLPRRMEVPTTAPESREATLLMDTEATAEACQHRGSAGSGGLTPPEPEVGSWPHPSFAPVSFATLGKSLHISEPVSSPVR